MGNLQRMLTIENVIRKIHGLLAVSKEGSGATIQERETAKTLANALRKKYKITEDIHPQEALERFEIFTGWTNGVTIEIRTGNSRAKSTDHRGW